MAGTVTITSIERSNKLGRMVIDCTADSSNGSFPATVISGPGLYSGRAGIGAIKGLLQYMDTNPGGTAPTDNYDIAITNAEGADVLRGAGANRDTANSERTPAGGTGVGDSGLMSPVFPTDTLTMAITGNSVNSATTRIVLYWDESVLK